MSADDPDTTAWKAFAASHTADEIFDADIPAAVAPGMREALADRIEKHSLGWIRQVEGEVSGCSELDSCLLEEEESTIVAVLRFSAPVGVTNEQPRWRHKNRGTVYIRKSGEDGNFWVRDQVEFEDGRFEFLPPPYALSSAPEATVSGELTSTQLAIVNDMTDAWVNDKKRYRIAFRDDCKRLLASASPQDVGREATIEAQLITALDLGIHWAQQAGKDGEGLTKIAACNAVKIMNDAIRSLSRKGG